MPDQPALHPDLEPLRWLVGTWRGLGVGGYPSISSFRYEEELAVTHDGRPFLSHRSRTWLVDESGQRLRPAHQEAGWWRAGVELVLAHPTGVVAVYVGEVTGERVELATDVVARTATAKEVSGLRRLYGLVPGADGQQLAYAIDLAAGGHPLQPHLSARLSLSSQR